LLTGACRRRLGCRRQRHLSLTPPQRVFLLRFPDRGAQSAALTRLSLFLEDADGRGTVAAAPPAHRTAGVAAYSGHNCRAGDAADFFNAARCALPSRRSPRADGARSDGGVQLDTAWVTSPADRSFADCDDDDDPGH